MPLSRRMFAQLVASAILLRHLPAFAQTSLTVAIGDSPNPETTQRVVSAGAPADMLLLAVAPEKLVGLLAYLAGLIPRPTALRPSDLVPEFSWSKVGQADRIVDDGIWEAL